ncbi:hypothetical protein Cagg_3533 [Chloroflexus aggregans DSM 9485]|uniref:Uncharacterized protein n=1 Tax=Chloroflexus aggregans (strain MD-66 / DSM 9485) TaxID=326427 RepID=B8G9L8_CHLAD|nr:hypothetical protein Cagg_3533 [Chloroflexus aggregans DSM 9485]
MRGLSLPQRSLRVLRSQRHMINCYVFCVSLRLFPIPLHRRVRTGVGASGFTKSAAWADGPHSRLLSPVRWERRLGSEGEPAPPKAINTHSCSWVLSVREGKEYHRSGRRGYN